MDIYSILSSKPHNPHYLNRYITFIEHCQQKNVGHEGPVENHHICPKAKDMFPEYKDFRSHPWNKAPLTPRQHFIAHLILWKVFVTTRSCLDAVWNMTCRGKLFVNSRLYETMRLKSVEVGRKRSSISNKNMTAVIDGNGNIIRIKNTDKRFIDGELKHYNTDYVTAKDHHEKVFRVKSDDPRLISGDLVGIQRNKLNVNDKDGNILNVSKHDPRYISGELKSIFSGNITAKDKNGKVYNVTKNDPRYVSGELVGITKGTVPVRCVKTGITIRLEPNDERITNGEYVVFSKNRVTVKDSNGNTMQVSTADPRYKSGELKPINNGYFVAKDKHGNRFRITKEDPRYISGELVGVMSKRFDT